MKDATRITAVQRAGLLTGSRGRRGRAFLARISGKDSGRVYGLVSSQTVIGRSSSSDIVIREDGVSRKHAKIVRDEDGTAKILDLESTHGTYVNGLRVEVEALREGDQVRVGLTATFEFRFEYLPHDDGLDGPRRFGARARSLAQLARDGFALIEEDSLWVADVDAWLIAHGT